MQWAVSQGWLEAVMLAGVRMTAFVFIAPPFSYRAFPARVRAMLGIGLALAVSPVVAGTYAGGDPAAFLMALLGELVIGSALGLLVFVVFQTVQSAGHLIDIDGGFQLAMAFDPTGMVNGAQFTRLFQMLAIALLFASDGYQLVLLGLTRTFQAIPLGGSLDWSRLAYALVSASSQLILSALLIAGPLVIVLFLADVGLGLLTRVAPALNAFSMDFPLKILLVLLFGGTVLLALPAVVSSLVERALDWMAGVTGG